jgi:tetratricopeptide (TPR) repeat protein
VHLCRSAYHTSNPQNRTLHNHNKLHQFSRVLAVAVFLFFLTLSSPPAFAQTSTGAVDEHSRWNSEDPSEDGSRVQRPSPYIVSVSHLKAPAKAVNHLEAARRHFAKMQLAQADKEIDRAIEVYPGFAQAFCIKALVSLAEKDFIESVENAAHAIRLDGADAYSWVALATAYNSLSEWPEAEAAAGQALLLDPSAWQGRLELAKSFYGEAKFALALNILDHLNRDIPDAHLVRANSLMRLGRPQEAARQFSVFLQQAPGDSRGDQIRRILLRVQPARTQSEE